MKEAKRGCGRISDFVEIIGQKAQRSNTHQALVLIYVRDLRGKGRGSERENYIRKEESKILTPCGMIRSRLGDRRPASSWSNLLFRFFKVAQIVSI